ncbi:uncharacterized protein LOC106389356 [Brassica napus]|nr:PREDICTED: uncharacterized protein LOC106336326 [Brassica oleracea var. oleracea]XP_013685028.1 uncharacterized protein LOC106389356 [Brassica napus]CAF1705239.1 unnamed protein product [Brassica napus]
MEAANKQIPLSDDLNYQQWAPIAKKKLVENGVWDVVTSGVPFDPTKLPELAARISPKELAEWRDRAINDMKALKILQSSLPASTYRKTFSVASAKDLWDLLKSGNEAPNRPKLTKEFDDLEMYDGESMDSYLERVLDIVERFRRYGNPKSDDEVITKLLTSLTWPYDEAATVLEEIMSLPDMTLNDLIGLCGTFGDYPVEFTIGELKKSRKSLEKAKSEQMWCGLCKKYDHNQEDCYRSDTSGQCHVCGARGGDCARGCTVKKNGKPEHLMLAVTTGDFAYEDGMWMVYSTASDHMTPYLKQFTTLDRTYKARVGMANGKFIMAEGKEDVKITMKGVRKVIKNVLFVPGINRNVLSISKLTSGGGSVEIGGGECTIKDETGKVFAKTRFDERGIALRLKVIR